jgi:hypothetical protein
MLKSKDKTFHTKVEGPLKEILPQVLENIQGYRCSPSNKRRDSK